MEAYENKSASDINEVVMQNHLRIHATEFKGSEVMFTFLKGFHRKQLDVCNICKKFQEKISFKSQKKFFKSKTLKFT